MDTKKFTEQFITIAKDGAIESNCNSITFINLGGTTAEINGLPLGPGEQYVSQGNFDEINVTKYLVTTNGNEIRIIRKVYNS